jgi:hypothetical protein
MISVKKSYWNLKVYPVGFCPWRRTAEYRTATVTDRASNIEKNAHRLTRVASIAP